MSWIRRALGPAIARLGVGETLYGTVTKPDGEIFGLGLHPAEEPGVIGTPAKPFTVGRDSVIIEFTDSAAARRLASKILEIAHQMEMQGR